MTIIKRADDPIGFLGLGVMGEPMAARLQAAGVDLMVWNRTAARSHDFASRIAGDDAGHAARIRVADSPAAVAESCRVIVSCLLDDAVIETVHGGPDGTLARCDPGTIVIEHGTFSPELALRLAELATRRGCVFLDAPVTGGSVGASAGTLTTMVGGDPAAVDAVRPLLAHYTRLVELVGPPGSGVALKLINQMLVATHSVAVADAARVITALGIPHDVAERVLTSGWAASAMLARNLRAALRDTPLDEGAEMHHLALALGILHGIVTRSSIATTLEPVVLQRFEYAMQQGLGTTDISGIIRALDPHPSHAMSSSHEGRLIAAVEDNATWCDIVCTTHDLATAWGERVWSVSQHSPEGYPDAVTMSRDVDPREIVNRIGADPGTSVKDSFSDLELDEFGFEILFDASWIYLPSTPAVSAPDLDHADWEAVDDEATLGLWAAAHGMVDVFRPALLNREDVRILGCRVDGDFVAGAVAVGRPRAVGLSNVFCRRGDPVTSYARAASAARSCFPGRPVVGYERDEDLEHALAVGFRVIGPLRVWLKT